MNIPLDKAQKRIVYDIARIQTKDLTYILLKNELIREVYEHVKKENYDITIKEVKDEVRKQLNQWAKVKKNTELFGQLLDSTEKNWLRHHVYAYYMKHDKTEGLWAKLNIQEELDKLNLN